MMLKCFVAALAALTIALPAAASDSTGTRLDRGERAERRSQAQEISVGEKKEWHYANGSQQTGPLSLSDLLAAAEAGTVKSDTQVYRADTGWRVAAQVPELAAVVK